MRIEDARHIKLCGDTSTYCGHPRQGGIFDFPDGEIAVIHNHAPCAYRVPEDVHHDYFGYHRRSTQLLQRSRDGGDTWLESDNVVVFREADPIEQRRELLDQYSPTARRDNISLGAPDSCIYFGRTWAGDRMRMGCRGSCASRFGRPTGDARGNAYRPSSSPRPASRTCTGTTTRSWRCPTARFWVR